MGESGEATLKEENPLQMAFVYCDALVNTLEQRNDKMIVRETVRLAYKEVRVGPPPLVGDWAPVEALF